MANPKDDLGRSVLMAHGDPIRIVPLSIPEELVTFRPEAIGAAAPPKLTYRNGPLLSSVEVFTIFWGAVWQHAPQNDNLTKVNSFFDFILTSSLLDQLAEYNVPNYSITHGRRVGMVTLTSPTPKKSVSDSQIQHLLQQEITTNKVFPTPTKNTLYFVYLPPGVSVSQGGSRSCQAFCGYHNDLHSQIFYAVMPYPSCNGCLGNLAILDDHNLPAAQASSNWLQFNFDPQHSGSTNQETLVGPANVNGLQKLFQVSLTGGTADGAPAYLSGVNTPTGPKDLIFVTTKNGYIMALEAHTGTQVWAKQNGPGNCKINHGSTYPGYQTDPA